MKIYVGTYSKYSGGSIEGAWIDTGDYSDFEEFSEACHKLHKDEDDPEYMVQDIDGDGWERALYQESGIGWVATWYEVRDELGSAVIDEDVFSAFIEATGYNVEADTVSKAEDAYCGHHEGGLEGYVEDALEEGLFGDIPESVRGYIDTAAIARDLKCEGYAEQDGHVFRP